LGWSFFKFRRVCHTIIEMPFKVREGASVKGVFVGDFCRDRENGLK